MPTLPFLFALWLWTPPRRVGAPSCGNSVLNKVSAMAPRPVGRPAEDEDEEVPAETPAEDDEIEVQQVPNCLLM